jgi:hypothetical protein
MKKIFALFSSFCLIPTFSAQAWIGGPFSENTYFGVNGDDGIYEAIATGVNAIGIFRIIVDNEGQSLGVTVVTDPNGGGQTIVQNPVSGNTSIGGLTSTNSNVWFVNGISYFGNCVGTVNSKLGIVSGIGFARDPETIGAVADSSFSAQLDRSGRNIASIPFSGRGVVRITSTANQTRLAQLRFRVFGTKVSNSVNYGQSVPINQGN